VDAAAGMIEQAQAAAPAGGLMSFHHWADQQRSLAEVS
jgi:hypothetical protein